MRQTDYKRKGFTLVEISIVIALIGIAATLIITFTGFMGKRVGDVTNYKTTKEELNEAETMIGKFIRHYDNISYEITPTADGITVTYKGNGGGSGVYAKLYYDSSEKKLIWAEYTAEYADNNSVKQALECRAISGFLYHVESDEITVGADNSYYLFCYFLQYSNNTKTHVVMINVRSQGNPTTGRIPSTT